MDVVYDAHGSTHVASTNNQIELGPTNLNVALDYDTGDLTGSMPLPQKHTNFYAAGFIPMSADVSFEEAAPLTGHLQAHPDGGGSYVESTATYHIRLTNIKVVGFPTFSGPHCRTVDPVTIAAATPDGERFNVFTGGNITGEYEIGDFQNCGLNTWLVNQLVPGAGNTLDLTLSNGQPG